MMQSFQHIDEKGNKIHKHNQISQPHLQFENEKEKKNGTILQCLGRNKLLRQQAILYDLQSP